MEVSDVGTVDPQSNSSVSAKSFGGSQDEEEKKEYKI
jgi:hypothetical protein